MHPFRPIRRLASLALPALLLLAACSGEAANPPGAEATISALATSNAALATQVADLSNALKTPAPASAAPAQNAVAAPPAALSAPVSPLAMPAAAAPVAPGSQLPRLVANLPLAPEGATLTDLRFDAASNRLYVTDTADRLHVLDATSFAELATLPLGGNLELDAQHGRLYVYQPYVREGEDPTIHVVDTTTLAEVGALRGGALAIDAERNRLFVGEPYTYSSTEDAPGVRVIDGATLQVLGEIDQPGAPLYNPARNELLIVAYTLYTANPDTFEVTGDLFPNLTDLAQIGLLWCNGCRWVDNAWVLPAAGLVAVDISAHCAGKGCGVEDAPRWLDAATLSPVAANLAPELQADCGTTVSVAGAVGERFYRNRFYNRTVAFTNLFVEDTAGAPITRRDGLSIEFVNAQTGQGYLSDGRVIDLATLTPVGRWPAACILAYDPARGRLYGKREGSLYVIEERGGAPSENVLPQVEALPDAWITGLVASPNFASDNTLLATTETGVLYRSVDGGGTWAKLRGGLPDDAYQQLYAFFSPAYAADQTIYVTGQRSDAWGYGVWRSTDGGDTWAPLWNNLQHLRGEAITFAPDFAQNPTLVLKANFHDVLTGVSGASYQQSTDGGLSWSLVVTGDTTSAAGQEALPSVSELLPGAAGEGAPAVQQDFAQNRVLLAADGRTWVTTTLTIAPGELVLGVFPAPSYPTDATLYVVSSSTVWRTTDGGVTWAQWGETRFAAPDDYDNKIRSALVTPLLSDGGYRLYLGAGAGAVLALDPAAMDWQEVTATTVAAPGTQSGAEVAAADATGALLPTPTPAPAAPLTGEPSAGLFRPEGDFALNWENNLDTQQALGWALTAQPTTSTAALQRFDNGVMIWVQETGRIYAILHDGRWFSFEDTFREGEAEFDPAFSPPEGRQQPMRGFGKLWREQPDLRDAIGWALAKEEPATATRQSFERGEILRVGVFLYTMAGEEEGRWK
jgi:photosystem II stability/assembly factor-like uncharacterized protein